MLAPVHFVSEAAHASDDRPPRFLRYAYDYDDGFVMVYSCDLPGPGVAGGLLRVGIGADRVGRALRRARAVREGLEVDESMPLSAKLIVGLDVMIGATNIVVGACDIVIGASGLVDYARAGVARIRGKASRGGFGAKSNLYLLEDGSKDSSGVKRNETGSTIKPVLRHRRRICEIGKYDVCVEDLPEETLRIILSKLELKEAARTSVLSSKWTNMWTHCRTLRFIDSEMFSKYWSRKQVARKFIENVNSVLALHRGKKVETLQIKVESENRMLFDHLDSWVSFAAASQTKNLALDLAPKGFTQRTDRYPFPFKLLDGATMSRMEQIQLSFVYLNLPSKFSGFPKLRRLDLHEVDGTSKYLHDMLLGCSNLEWLSLVRCSVKDELIINRPMSHLLYLRISNCDMSKIELRAPRLKTFIFKGVDLPVNLVGAQELKVADINLICSITLEFALTVLPQMLKSVQNLTLDAPLRLTTYGLLETSYQFSQLKRLKLLLLHSSEDMDNILSLASFLRAAPLIEELEIHFNVSGQRKAETRYHRSLPNCRCLHLRCMRITGFKGIKGQAEFLVHTLENAPALEVLTIDTANRIGPPCKPPDQFGLRIAKSCLEGRISPWTKLHILS